MARGIRTHSASYPKYRAMLLYFVLVISGLGERVLSERSCSEERFEAEMEYARMLSVEDVPYFYIPECDVTGDWQDLQTDSFNMRWCVDTQSGEVLSHKSDMLMSCGGCLAARLAAMRNVERAEKAGARINNVYFPDCEEVYPEYYEEEQCWSGYFNACWCVDPRTGNPTSYPTENEVGCSRDGRVPATWCRVLSSLTTSYYSAYDSISGDEPDIVAQVECTQDGRFAQEQCLGEECWCVERDRGHILEECPGSRGRGKRNAAHSVCLAKRANQLEAYYEFVIRGVMLEHFTIPSCGARGDWETLQCSNQTGDGERTCWCVDAISGVQSTGASHTLTSCASCRAHVLRADTLQQEDYTTCDETGESYTPIQCSSESDCWCVHPRTGAVLYRPSDGLVTGLRCEQITLQ